MDGTNALLGAALLIAMFFGGLWLFKRGASAFFGLQIKHQVAGLAVISAGLAAITPVGFFSGFVGYGLLLGAVWGYVMLKIGGFKRQPADTIVRGNQLVDVSAVQKMVAGEESTFSIGEVAIPRKLEVSHFLLAGTTRTGKSQAFLAMMYPIRAKRERCVVGDVGGEFTARFFRPGIDKSLNCFDQRGSDWSPLCEMQGEWDAEKLAASLIPKMEGTAGEFNGYGQTLLAAVLVNAWQNDGNNGEILRILTRAPISELKEYVAGQPAEGFFAEGNDRMLASIIGVVTSYIKPLQYLNPQTGVDGFSIRAWVADESNDSWLFLNFADSQFASLKPIIAASLDIAISACLELKPDQNRRVWFMLDELATYGYLGSLRSLLEKGAKYGAPCVVGLQSLSQLRESFGRETAQTILANLGTQLILRSPDADSAEYLSQLFGSQDIQRVNHSTSTSDGGVSHGQSVQYTTQRTIMPAEIMSLPNLVGLLNVVGPVPPCVVNIPIAHGEEVAERFVAKPRKAKAEAAAVAELEPA